MSGYSPDASAVVTFWRIWSATTPPVVALTLMSECVLLKSSASWPRTLPAMSSWPCHIVISVTPPDCFSSSLPPPPQPVSASTATATSRANGRMRITSGTSVVERTTERVRLRGRSGSRPAASASATPVRWASTSEASGSRSGATAIAPVARTLSSRLSSGGPKNHTAAPGPAMLIGPWRYSKAG